jgi:hypothetical protein
LESELEAFVEPSFLVADVVAGIVRPSLSEVEEFDPPLDEFAASFSESSPGPALSGADASVVGP